MASDSLDLTGFYEAIIYGTLDLRNSEHLYLLLGRPPNVHLLCCRLKSFDRNVEVSFTFGSDEAASGGSQAGYAWNAER